MAVIVHRKPRLVATVWYSLQLTLCHPLSSVFRNADKMADNENNDEPITIDSDDDDLEVTHYATPTASSMTPPRRVLIDSSHSLKAGFLV